MSKQLCLICEEGIFNPICPACLINELAYFFQDFPLKEDLKEEILEEAEILKTILEIKEVKMKCAICKKESFASVCPFCFLKEIYYVILEKDTALAKDFCKIFNFDFGPTEAGSTGDYWKRDF